ncbi:pimeloyl-ACP methyl ester carboxylesterase [Paenibacillus taihuensis]|uniref:Pimeloyl-ACP methyl ester carboxylesterase n=1 Tax=Paenibacillus taihuensis TaxID=1156355 RepID=A0A3D9R121_9BACL|nr:alpha/beta hydrolase [Paenibacillus taihuensis]REE67334.1 pimeloyl-ACP methyl ester carboxylesterase [Paenibacillus taihuensis]
MIEKVTIGGISQYILIQTEKPGSPILLFLHGGPSMPIPGVSSRNLDYILFTNTKQLVKHYTLVYWDQRATGKTYSKTTPVESVRLEQYIEDAHELTAYLLERYNQPQLHLIGYSWGTVIGLSLIQRYSQLYYSYIAFAQIIDWVENDKLCYEWLFRESNQKKDRKTLKQLKQISEPPYRNGLKEWGALRRLLLRYNSMIHKADRNSPTAFWGIKMMFKSKDYSILDIYNSLYRGFLLSFNENMIKDINTLSFFRIEPKVDIPILFIHGREDKHVWPAPVLHYFDLLNAPQGKTFLWSEKSSHIFHPDDARTNEQRILQFLDEIQ